MADNIGLLGDGKEESNRRIMSECGKRKVERIIGECGKRKAERTMSDQVAILYPLAL